MNADPRVGHLLIRWQQLRAQGRTPSAGELCADCPELCDSLQRQIQKLTALEAGLPGRRGSPDATPTTDPDEAATAGMARPPAGASATDDETDSAATIGNPPGPPAAASKTLPTVAAAKPSASGPPPTLPPSTEEMRAAAALPPGSSDGRSLRGYRLLERLGGGTYGVVYRALSSGGVEVAVKEVRHSIGQSEARRELEALELIKGLRHPYLLALHDFWIEGDRLYMALELADGTLAQAAASAGPKGMYQPEAMHIFEEAAEALDFLHGCHVLHRDIKPANILLLRGHTKVADLGLAKFKPEEVAVSQTVAGTPAYMAPETFRNEFRAESDQYALALCYAEVRLGRQLCEGTTLPSAIHWHIYAEPNLEGLRPHEETAVRRALSKDPAGRFPSCQEFVRALQEPRPPPTPAPPPKRSWLPLAAALPAVVVLAFVAWWFLPRSEKPRVAPPPPDLPATPQVDWTPESHGFVIAPDAQIKTDEVGHKRYYDRVVKRVGNQDVAFLLVPRRKPGDPQTFYAMENKVSNGLFKTAVGDPEFHQLIADAKQKYPALKWGEWTLGGVRNGNVNVGSDDDALPVLRVNVMEAFCFAQWLGGALPTEPQWDQAAGEGSGAKEIYRDPEIPLQPGDVAVNRRAEGPMPVGTAPRDVSPLGCRDMAANGAEWTRNLDSGELVPPPAFSPDLLVNVCGQAYYRPDPYHYYAKPDWRPSMRGDPAVGFRVVVEP